MTRWRESALLRVPTFPTPAALRFGVCLRARYGAVRRRQTGGGWRRRSLETATDALVWLRLPALARQRPGVITSVAPQSAVSRPPLGARPTLIVERHVHQIHTVVQERVLFENAGMSATHRSTRGDEPSRPSNVPHHDPTAAAEPILRSRQPPRVTIGGAARLIRSATPPLRSENTAPTGVAAVARLTVNTSRSTTAIQQQGPSSGRTPFRDALGPPVLGSIITARPRPDASPRPLSPTAASHPNVAGTPTASLLVGFALHNRRRRTPRAAAFPSFVAQAPPATRRAVRLSETRAPAPLGTAAAATVTGDPGFAMVPRFPPAPRPASAAVLPDAAAPSRAPRFARRQTTVDALPILRRREQTIDLPHIQETLTRRVEETLQRRVIEDVETVVSRELSPDSTLARRLSDRIYGGLYESLVLEKERLGLG